MTLWSSASVVASGRLGAGGEGAAYLEQAGDLFREVEQLAEAADCYVQAQAWPKAREVAKVKRSENGIIFDPITLPPNETVGNARKIMEENKVSGVPITVDGYLKGILTRRDLKFLEDNSQLISEVMSKDNLITAA
jgi:signal-transduction protein with cAMP-binding, CBS, and nucleotidyltransferase domain